MYCPNCKTRKEGRFCPDCGTQLIEEIEQSQLSAVNLSLGDANAISGGVHVTNTTNIVERTKTDNELLHDNEKKFINQCKRCIEDFVISNEELMELESLRLDLGITKERADELLESIRQLAMKASIKAQLSGLGKIKAKQFSDAILKNNKQLLEQMLGSIEALVLSNENEELRFKYYMVLAGLYPERCIEKYKSAANDEYWLCFWTYIAYVKINKMIEAEKLLCELEAKYLGYPSENAVLLAAGGVVISQGLDSIADYLDVIEGDYSPILQRYVDALYVIVDSNNSIEGCDFYLEYILPVSSQEEVNQRQKEILRLQAIEDSRAKARADKRMIFNEDCSILLDGPEEGEDIVSYELPLCVKQIGLDVPAEEANCVFSGCSNLKSVILHENLEIIGTGAFCKSTIEELRIPNSVKKICSYAFQTTKNLKHVEIPLCLMDTTEWFCDSNINSVSLPEGMREIGSFMFLKTPELKHITLPSTITSIGERAFKESAIQEIIIPEGVKEIGEEAFCECNNLMKVKLPSTITSIGKKVFAKSAIKEIIIPEGVKKIREYAFNKCYNLSSVTLPKSLYEIGNLAFVDCSALKDIYLYGVPKVFERTSFNTRGVNIHLLDNEPSAEYERFIKLFDDRNSTFYVPNENYSLWKNLFKDIVFTTNEIILIEGTTEIEKGFLSNLKDVERVVIPSTVTSIGELTFEFSTIGEIIISEGVSEINENAFSCVNVGRLVLPSTIKYIAPNAFASSKNALFADKYRINEVVLSEGITEISDEAFKNANIDRVLLPSTLKKIGRSAFKSVGLKEINIPNGVKEIGQFAFMENNIENLIIPSSVTTINESVFFSNDIKQLTIPEGVSQIERGAFFRNTKLEEVILPSTITSLGTNAFALCESLKDVYLYSIPKEICTSSFPDTKGYMYNLHIMSNKNPAEYEYLFKRTFKNARFCVSENLYKKFVDYYKDRYEFISESITDIRGEAKTVEEIKKISNEKQEITNKTERSSVDKVETNKGSQSNIIIDKLWVETDGKKEFTMSWLWTANNMDGHSLKCCVNIKAKSGKDLDFKSITVNKEFQIKGQSFQSKTGISLSYNEFNIAHNEEKKIEFNIEIYDSITQKCVYTSENEEFNLWYYFNVFSANIFKLRSGKKYPPGDLTQISFI